MIDLAREMPKNSAYYYDLMHYTNAGAALVADIVAAQLTPFLARKFPAYYQGSALPRQLPLSLCLRRIIHRFQRLGTRVLRRGGSLRPALGLHPDCLKP